ncbi:DinB family protein [Mucilaginibacter sp. HC2]|uniref:DinB family protein n=1 Tax=Mucilaginibacter inviolabilis TaxID=2714892 RepID=UPI0014086C02|nr:DinB family protein [Mucilaginibacter inviolabilis]NHA05217.1 DinB family protein [Mucilaginibacter inviolabilis]
MQQSTEIIKLPRVYILNLINDLSTEQLNHIPKGFNNNLIWNLAHLISAQQGICYTRAGLPVVVEDKYYTPFQPNTKPERFIDAGEIAHIKELFLSSIDRLELDMKANIFTNYPAWLSRYGTTIASFADAFAFLPFHEGLHCGYIMALKRAVLNELV